MLPRIHSLLLLLPWSFISALRRNNSLPSHLGAELQLLHMDLSLPAAELKLERDASPCTEQSSTGVINFICQGFRQGNALMMYWNGRANALFKNMDFEMTASREDMVSQFPHFALRGKRPTELQVQLWNKMQAIPKVCWECPFPHTAMYAPWRLIGDIIFTDTRSVVKDAIKHRTSKARWEGRGVWAVLHFRCDKTLWTNEGYGFFRYRFIEERLPKDATDMLIVGPTNQEPLCQNIADDLAEWLRESRNLGVSFQALSPNEDWLTLATAPLLFCSPSTYCLTAGMGNPNTVYYPVNGGNLAVFQQGPEIEQANSLLSPGFHWVVQDYLPGPAAIEVSASTRRAYFHARSCDEARHWCVPVGGSIPERYRFH